MGKIYARFKELKKESPQNWFMDKIGLVNFEKQKTPIATTVAKGA